MKKYNKLLNFALPLITIFCILLFWTVASISVGSEYILPSIPQTLTALFGHLTQGKFYVAFLLTLLRSLIAFACSFVIAGGLAFLAHKSKVLERLIMPLVSITRSLPTIAIVLLLLFWANEQVAPVIVTMLVVMPTTYTQLKNALESVDISSLEAGMVDGANKKQLFIFVQFPQIEPALYNAIGGGIALNFKLMVAAEVLSATVKSLGSMLNIAKYNGEIASMLAIVTLTVLVGFVIEFAFNKLASKRGEWR